MPFQNEQLRDLVIRTIIGEAGGEGPNGWRAVAHVIRNRYEKGGYGNGLVQILRPDQFSANAKPFQLDRSDPTYQRVAALVDNVFDGDSVDPTGGATHYYNPTLAQPAWGPGMADRKQIGNHAFGKADVKLGEHGLDPRTQNALEWIQARAREEGIPLRVTSTRRSPEENARVGGDRDSQHLKGRGFDLGYRDLTPAQQARVEEIAMRAPGVNGLKGEGDHLHVDTREGYRYVGGNFQPSVQASLAAFRQGHPLEPIAAVAPAVPAAPAAAPGGPQSVTPAAPAGAQPVVPTLSTSIAAATPATGPVVKTADIPAATATPAASASLIDLPPPPAGVYDATPAATPAPLAPPVGIDVEEEFKQRARELPQPEPPRSWPDLRLRQLRTPVERPPPLAPAPPVGFDAASAPASGDAQPIDRNMNPLAQSYESRPLAPTGTNLPIPAPKPLPLDPFDRPPLAPKPLPLDPFDRPGEPLGALPDRADLPLAPPIYRESPNNPGNALTSPLATPAAARKPEPVTTGSTGSGNPPLPPARPPELGGPGGQFPISMAGPSPDWDTMLNIARGGMGATPFTPQQTPPPYLSAQAPQNPFGLLFQRLFGMS